MSTFESFIWCIIIIGFMAKWNKGNDESKYGSKRKKYKSKDNKSEYSDEEIEKYKKIYGLDDEEVREIKNGNHDPWDFEETDATEESDYYNKD